MLQALCTAEAPGAKVLRARSENDYFIVVTSDRLVDVIHSQRIIMTLDSDAHRTFSSREHSVGHMATASPREAQLMPASEHGSDVDS